MAVSSDFSTSNAHSTAPLFHTNCELEGFTKDIRALSKDEMKSHKSTRADELAQPHLSWPASTSLIVMVTIGSSASSMAPANHFHYCLFLFLNHYSAHSPKSCNVSAVNVY